MILENEKIKQALEYIKEEDPATTQDTLNMCQIPAPSYKEEKKAEYIRERFREIGLRDVRIDAVGNVLGIWPGTGEGPSVMLAAHTDTVFPEGTDLTIRKEGNRYYCPGINDDTHAVAEMIAVAKAMIHADLHTKGDLIFCANVCEEGLGDLRGIKHVFKDMADTEGRYDGFVSIDDKKTSGIIYQAVGSERYLVTFHGTGGHSFTGFGIPNPIHAMGRAIAKISDFQTPKNPKTTFSVGVVNGGTSVNVIAAECSMLVDMRSVDAGELEKLSAKLHQAIKEAVNEENARWGYGTLSSESTGPLDDNNMTAKSSVGDTAGAVPVNADNGDRETSAEDDRIAVTFEQKGRRPAGTQDKSCQIVQAANAANQAIGMETLYIGAASTDANIPISLGIPAITVGWGGKGGGEHTIHEWYEPVESWKGPQRDLLLLLALSGYEGVQGYQLPCIER